MGRRKKSNPRGEALAKMILEAYKPSSREEVQDAFKDIFGPIFEAMLQGEMEGHLGYASNDHGSKGTDNRRNGYIDNYGSAVRKVMYTTNAIESVNSSFRKVTKKGAFPSQNALLKLLYLRVTELYPKWGGRPVPNWAMVRNQLMDDKIHDRFLKFEDS